MTKQQHPITPPPELVRKWLSEYFGHPVNGEISSSELDLATQAARWSADQELEACVEWIQTYRHSLLAADLRGVRRPKPPSLKERALEALETEGNGLSVTAASVIRRALEALPDD